MRGHRRYISSSRAEGRRGSGLTFLSRVKWKTGKWRRPKSGGSYDTRSLASERGKTVKEKSMSGLGETKFEFTSS